MKLPSLQLSVCGFALLAALCACGASHPQNNSNTNWLRECSASKDCSSDELCACGVCTVPCTNDDACQSDQAPDAVCASVAALECSGSSKGAVCTASCTRDEDCGGGALSCVEGSCVEARVGTAEPESDAGVEPDAEAPVEIEDGGSIETTDSGTVGPTEPPPPEVSCEERLGCDADSACLNDHCQRLWSGEDCEPAAEIRAACTTDADCRQGLLCHIDGTCIEPGKCDRFGMATLASVGSINGLTVTKDSVFVGEAGTRNMSGNSRADGAIKRVGIDDGSVQPLVTGLLRPGDLLVDSQHVYWTESSNTDDTAYMADRADGANPTELTIGPDRLSWVQNATHLYFVTQYDDGDGYYELFRMAKGTTHVERLTNENWRVFPGAIGIDSRNVYVPNGTQEGVQWSLTDKTPSASPWPVPAGVFDAKNVYAEDRAQKQMVALRRDDGQRTVLASDVYKVQWYRPYGGQLYIAYETDQEDLAVESVPLTPGDPVTIISGIPFKEDWFVVDIGDRGLFWLQPSSSSSQNHLLRLVSDAFSAKPAISQGAEGGPCFDDLACDSGLTCIDAVCAIAPTCEERLGCDAASACFNERCHRLWSGDGCAPAADGRPFCVTDDDCGSGLVCHVDGTCIEPGKCDRFGMTTLATVGDAAAMTLTKDSVFVLDKSTDDALGNDQSTGAILNVSIADGHVQTVIGNLYRPLDLKVDGSRVYWQHGVKGEIGFGWADRADGGHPGDLLLDGDTGSVEWLLSSDHVYVLMVKSADRDWLLRFAKGSTTLETLTDQGLNVAYGMGLDRDYVYFDAGRRWSLADNMVLEPTPTSANVSDPSFIDHERIYHVGFDGIGYTTKADNHRVVLSTSSGGYMFWLKAYRDDVYWLTARLPDEDIPMESLVRRAPLTPGDTETVAYLPDGTRLADISDRGLFSIQGHRLVREVIEDYASGPSPAQGESGAPCFGDGTCNGALSCLDALCE